ncbi:Sodium Bile acid symporter family protein [Botrimarina colliarenosi]|uniref:Sodium Bile acid symporter family protein n=1 Tax=Botrimarina colliarenosi TaxID=2528001 RepID=A0A5C6ABW6_9BACT|nr:bile acid:sodium symporter [Botrimarina colliarenosi]TWT96900.1 Sodium Bile acid symporter family protein [Botrimarina colliarenosi]
MPTRDAAPPTPPHRAEATARWVRRWLVGLLAASYVLAAAAPAAGVWMAGLGADAAGDPTAMRFSLVMVGVLLVCGAMAVDVVKLRELPERPLSLLIALAGVWGPPLVVVGLWGVLAPAWLTAGDAAALAVGLALAGAMPVANSAVAWTHQSGGSLVWALGLVVLSICLCPWVTPALLRLMGLTLTGSSAAAADLLVSRFTGAIFLVWVLGPTLLGFAIRAVAGARRVAAITPWLTIVSAVSLLLLNYANAATALPKVFAESHWALLATTVIAAATLPLAGALPAWPASALAGVSRRGRIAWAYSLGMKNTGLALGLAGATLGDQPVAVLAILAVTLTQHMVAGGVHAWVARSAE